MAAESSSTSDSTDIFHQLDSYAWEKDAEFQVRPPINQSISPGIIFPMPMLTPILKGGLSAILGATTSPAQIEELTLRAQVFYLSRKISTPIDFDTYKAYLSSKTSSPDPSAPPPHHTPSSIEPPPPLTDASMQPPPSSTISPPAQAPETTDTTSSGEKPLQAPYPPTFAEIVSLITTGAPIPGIKDIPPTLLTDQATKPSASRRRKPWEKEPVEGEDKENEGTFGDRRDEVIMQELPE